MKSKQALENIEKTVKECLCNYDKDYCVFDYQKWYFKTRFDAIEIDLERLEAIKRLLFEEDLSYTQTIREMRRLFKEEREDEDDK